MSFRQRIREGALSALRTPQNPPAAPRLVPLRPPEAKLSGRAIAEATEKLSR